MAISIRIIEKTRRKVIIKRGIKATDYFSYLDEAGSDVLSNLSVMETLFDETIGMWLPKKYIKKGTSEYVQGVEVSLDYCGPIPLGFDLIELPAVKYVLFQGEPFLDCDYKKSVEEIHDYIKSFDIDSIGHEWDKTNPIVHLEPKGERGYIVLFPIK